MLKALERHKGGPFTQGPVVLVVMDGVAVGPQDEGNAVMLARTPTLDRLSKGLWTTLRAHGTAVGMPSDDDMGNSEVGHNALGAGRVFAQGARLVQEAIAEGRLFEGEVWKDAISQARQGGILHLLGLLSDGNVHSHEKHLHEMLRQAAKAGVQQARLHILLDGRDVPADSALIYVDRLEEVLRELSVDGRDYRIASGGGRMVMTMDRYEADWPMVERGWKTHILGEGPHFASARAAIEDCRKRGNTNDQYLDPFVIVEDEKPVGAVEDGDVFLITNFRGDRAIELCRAFEEDDFTKFDRVRRPKVFFAGMMQYDGDLGIPSRYLVEPPAIQRTISEYLVHSGVRQFAISETQKFGHVTYFWNGNRSGKFDESLETYVEIPSDRVPFEQRPWMKAAEITDRLVEEIVAGTTPFLRVNIANGDMVGHTGSLEAAVIAVEAVDLCVARILEAVKTAGGMALVTADHGNADEMFAHDKKGHIAYKKDGKPELKTSHTLNPVPLYVYDANETPSYELAQCEQPGLANVAATILDCLGFVPPEDYEPSLLQRKPN
ncbi:MAG: 2,3-bisphosphoglycerate-independent phosphoglycerate mutase [Myxococcales bacterium]|nr:2,3-bisphosphoglycerate-independent phosphoglycerate mutase [Myxococcales bacterium]